jgi:ferric-dicitrate binding protein FerR (iron transport regulator)
MRPNDHNQQLFRDMQEAPDKYSDQEIEAMIDDLDREPDVDEAWQQFARHIPSARPVNAWRKVAAILIGILTISGLSIAAVHIMRQAQRTEITQPTDPIAAADSPLTAHHSPLTPDTATIHPVTFDNVPLDKMLAEIAEYHHSEVVFQNEDARQLRFYFVWYRQQPLDKVIETLNHFERVDIVIDNKKLTVR